MPRRMQSRESKSKRKAEWERTLAARNPNWGRSESETPLPSPWADIPIPSPASPLPAPRPYSDERQVRSATSSPEASSSASRGTGKAVRVRHSAMYSDRPRRSRRNRGGERAQQSTGSRVEEEQDAGKGSSNELGPTISDWWKFETPSLNDSDSDYGSEELSTADLLLIQPKFDSVDDAMDYFCNSERAARAARDKALPLSRQSSDSSLENFEAQRVMVPPNQTQAVSAQEQASGVATQGRYAGAKEKFAENGKKWMSEEVRVAFQKYIEKEDDLKEFEYEFDELQLQCFHVENYYKIFHHFNFTVKLKEPGSSEWTSTPYFAEVKEILNQKIYFCCPLEPYENGDCYACKNQRMDDLKHPVIGAFDRGSPDTVFPFMYGSDSSSDDDDGPIYDEAWRASMRAAGIMVG